MEAEQLQHMNVTSTTPSQGVKKRSKDRLVRGKGKDIFESVEILLDEKQTSSKNLSDYIIEFSNRRSYDIRQNQSKDINEPLVRSIRNEISVAKNKPETWEECIEWGKRYAMKNNLDALNTELLICYLSNWFIIPNARI